MAKKKDEWLDGFLLGLVWAANNPEMTTDIEARAFNNGRAQEWINGNAAEIEAMRTGEAEPWTIVAKAPIAKAAKSGK